MSWWVKSLFCHRQGSHCETEPELLLHLSHSLSYNLPLLKTWHKLEEEKEKTPPDPPKSLPVHRLSNSGEEFKYLCKISPLQTLFMPYSLAVFFYNKALKTVSSFPWIARCLDFTILVETTFWTNSKSGAASWEKNKNCFVCTSTPKKVAVVLDKIYGSYIHALSKHASYTKTVDDDYCGG